MTVGTFLSFLTDQGDDFLVSKALGAQPLGLYQTAYKISNLPTTEGAGLIYQIIFPIFATIQTDIVRLKRGLIKALAVTFTLSGLFAAGVYLTAPFLVKLALRANNSNICCLVTSVHPIFKVLNIGLNYYMKRGMSICCTGPIHRERYLLSLIISF